MNKQCTDTLLMVRPSAFSYNLYTAANNYFQSLSFHNDIATIALEQFDAMVKILKGLSINVIVMEDTVFPEKPDAVFPNNWFTCNNNSIILYPLFAHNRRTERRQDIIQKIQSVTKIQNVFDLSKYENEQRYLEGSGSICFDHVQNILYACRSERTNEMVLKKCSQFLQYDMVLFSATDQNGFPVYHTNVLLCIAEKYALICDESIEDMEERKKVISSLGQHHHIIRISKKQMHAFAGNMLEVCNTSGERFLLMSQTAHKSLLPDQIKQLHAFATPLVFDVSAIECGGGSVRCMIAELFYG